MIQVLMITIGIALIMFAFGLFGNLPPTPDWLLSINGYIGDILAVIVYYCRWLFTPELFFGGMAIIFAIMLWQPLYDSSMFVLKKIPMLGIK